MNRLSPKKLMQCPAVVPAKAVVQAPQAKAAVRAPVMAVEADLPEALGPLPRQGDLLKEADNHHLRMLRRDQFDLKLRQIDISRFDRNA